MSTEFCSLCCGLYVYFIFLHFSFLAEILFLAEWWSETDITVYASDESFNSWGKEHALIIMNHTFEVDWLMGWIVADRSQTLGVSFLICSAQFFFFFWAFLLSSAPFLCFSEILFLAEWWSETDLKVYASDESYKYRGNEHALIIMNHTYEVDWLMGWIVADRCQTLGVSFPPPLPPLFVFSFLILLLALSSLTCCHIVLCFITFVLFFFSSVPFYPCIFILRTEAQKLS